MRAVNQKHEAIQKNKEAIPIVRHHDRNRLYNLIEKLLHHLRFCSILAQVSFSATARLKINFVGVESRSAQK